MELNVGIIGFGKMGQIRADTIDSKNGGKIISVFDNDESIDFRGLYKTSNYVEIIENPNIDVVFICTPNFLNKEITITSLKAGKHVFCEKPPAFTASDVEEIKKIESQSAKRLMYGFNHRHHDSIKEMKKIIDSGEYGKVLWVRGRYGKSVTKDFFNEWRAQKKLAGGGILIDQGIHMLDLFLYLTGDYDVIKAEVSNLYWNLEVEDNAFVILKNSKTGCVGSLHSTMTQWRHLFSLEIFLEKGYLVLNGLITSSGTYGEEILSIAKNRSAAPAATWEDEEHIRFHVNNSWQSEVDHFFDAIINDTPIMVGNSDDALKVMKIVDEIYKQA